MLVYLLKFSACLAIFMVFYKLFLERENMHQIKRYYLLLALVLSLSIPLITFVKYIEPTITETVLQPTDSFDSNGEIEELHSTMNYIPTILWSIYGLGFLIFGLKFSLNLFQIFKKISHNPKHKNQGFVNVLLTNLMTPHTFFTYIFLNKQKYEAGEIPQEVLIHEQTHATQKHSADVLFIELLQVVFWFNPLVYFIKKDIKLNHEFLADEAVLKQGIEPSTYQNILLTFSSNVTEPKLANAINYSSIKKRFTVMKTHTSKQKIWLRSFLLLPLMALTLYGFSEKKNIEKQSIKTNLAEISNLKKNPVLEISFNPDILKLNGKDTSLSELKKDFIKATNGEKSDLDIKTVGSINMSLMTNIMGELKGNLLKINLDERAYIISDNMTTDNQQKATPEEVEEYNKLASQHNAKPENLRIIKQKDFERMEYLYKKMSKEQKANAEPFPNFPPPPPPPAQKGNKAKDIPPPPPIPADATPEQKKKMQAIIDDYDTNVAPPPPPPAPKAPLDYVIEMAKKDATFYYESKLISSDEAINLLKQNKELNISTKGSETKEPKVYISKDPIVIKQQTKTKEMVMLNGKKTSDGSFVLSLEDLSNIKLTIESGTISNFKFKIPGKPTVSIKGNMLSDEAKALLKELSSGDAFQFFMIKNSENAVHPPVLIQIK